MRLDTLHTAETPEGIALSLRPAGLMARSLAYMIDLAIRLVFFIVLSIVTRFMGGVGTALMLIGFFALEWLYPVVFELSRRGATPGKRVMGLRVVMDSGLPVTPAAALIRNLLRTADFLPAFYGAGLTSMLLRRDSKRLGDLAAGTLVVFTDSVSLHGEVPAAEPLAPLRPLSMREQAAVVSWAGRARRLTPERLEELALIAQPVLPAAPPGAKATARLLGVAQWVMGRRNANANDRGARP
ncbi:RDD family protein [Variovorax robiniae]|uniref:RDD family protein n=1 Tax=Variovorax robiniae TaxID=1836199 RepID=A0ABU8X8R6_9BURK